MKDEFATNINTNDDGFKRSTIGKFFLNKNSNSYNNREFIKQTIINLANSLTDHSDDVYSSLDTIVSMFIKKEVRYKSIITFGDEGYTKAVNAFSLGYNNQNENVKAVHYILPIDIRQIREVLKYKLNKIKYLLLIGESDMLNIEEQHSLARILDDERNTNYLILFHFNEIKKATYKLKSRSLIIK